MLLFTFLRCHWLLVKFLSKPVWQAIFIVRSGQQPVSLALKFLILSSAFVFFLTVVDYFCFESKSSHRQRTAISVAGQFLGQLCHSKLSYQDFFKGSPSPSLFSIFLTTNFVIFDKPHSSTIYDSLSGLEFSLFTLQLFPVSIPRPDAIKPHPTHQHSRASQGGSIGYYFHSVA